MRAWAECSEASLRGNISAIRSLLGAVRLMGVVKANAYGHGANWVARILLDEGASYLAVATPDEALSLREAGIDAPILLFGAAPPEPAAELSRRDITLTVVDFDSAAAYSKVARGLTAPVKCHLKLDTGMGRLGFRSADDAARALTLPGLLYEGIYTHLAVSDTPDGGEYTRGQISELSAATTELERIAGQRFALRHAANSGAVGAYPESLFDIARPGIMLYGCSGHAGFVPVMELKTRIAQIKTLSVGDSVSYGRTFTASRPTRAAIIPVGYADGLPRALSNKMNMSVCGKPAPQIGTICMDMCVLDVTDIPEAQAGSVVTVFGREPEYTARDAAALCGTISYELLCGVSARVPRVYV
jgi:alanine racemase